MDVIWYIAGIAGVGIILIVLLSVAVVRRSRAMRGNGSQTLDSFSGQHPLRGDQQETMTGKDSNIPGGATNLQSGPLNSYSRGRFSVGREGSDHPDEEYKGD